MDERVAMVTGAAQGVGEGVVKRLLRDGIKQLVIVDRNGEKLEQIADSLRSDGARDVLTVTADLSDVQECERAVRETEEKFGRLDYLSNCAGSTERGGILDASPETFERVFAINTRATFFMIQHAAKLMKQRKYGSIVSITSMHAYGGVPFLAVYGASKAALVALTKNAANTLRHYGIRVNAINLGWVVTPAEHEVQTKYHGKPEKWYEIAGKRQPFGRLLFPEDVGGLISYLFSKEAEIMTGSIIDFEQFVNGAIDEGEYVAKED